MTCTRFQVRLKGEPFSEDTVLAEFSAFLHRVCGFVLVQMSLEPAEYLPPPWFTPKNWTSRRVLMVLPQYLNCAKTGLKVFSCKFKFSSTNRNVTKSRYSDPFLNSSLRS
jgi:hypothetical protein